MHHLHKENYTGERAPVIRAASRGGGGNVGLGKWVTSEKSIKTPRRKNVSLKYLPGPETIKLCDSNDVKSELSGSPYLSILTRRIRPAAGKGGKREHT